MANIETYKKGIREAHPEWSEETVDRMARSQAAANNATNNTNNERASRSEQPYIKEKSIGGVLDYMGQNSRLMGQDIYKWFDNLISDETAEKNVLAKAGDRALNTIGGVIGGGVEAIAQTPRFVKDIISMPFSDKSEWGWGEVKSRANELQDDYGMNRVSSWLTAIDENNDSEHTSAQTIFQLLNNPFAFKGTGKVLESVGGLFKGGTKATRTIGKVGNVADDATKLSKGAKVEGAAEELAEDTARTGTNGNIISRIKNGATKTVDYVKNTKGGKMISDFTKTSARFLGGPVTDIYDIAKVGIKAGKTAMKTSGVGGAVLKGISATIGETIQTAGKFISKPLAYRTPRLITTTMADMLIGDNLETGMGAVDKGNFYKEYGYSLDVASSIDNEYDLQEFYDKHDIPMDKRLSVEELQKQANSLGSNYVSDFMEGAKNLFQMFDIFSAGATIYEQRKTDLGELEVERNVRGEFRGFSNGKSINFETGEIKDANGNQINFEDLTAEELKELGSMYNSMVSEAVSNNSRSTNPQDRAQQTGIKSNNITDVINNRAVNGMITSETAANLQGSANKGVRANGIWIIDQLNETTKEYTNSIINNFTVDEINNSTQLQQEIMNSLSAYSNLFNGVADIINNMSDDEYNDVYRFKKAMTASYNVLSDSDKNLIDDNLYKKSINYNNKLETGIDEAWMRSATWVKRATDTILDVLWTKDTNRWYDQGLSGIAGSLVNPELSGWGTAWAEISNGLRQNSAYAVDMVIFNRINDKVVEKFVGNKFKDAIRNNPRLNTKKFNAIKGAATEVSSEFLENFTDAISMVDDPNTDYNGVAGLMFGMFQGALAGYASATDSYTSFKDYMSRPENRELILNNMGIYINNIKKPEERAKVLSVVSQLMDDKSPNNLINIIQKTAGNVNNGVESYMQGYALYQINRMVANHINNMMNQVFNDLAQKGEAWNEDDIKQYFASDSDQTGMTEFKKFQSGQQFELNKNYINSIINSEDNRKETERIAKNSEAYIRASFEVNGMTLEEAINYMAPKIDTTGEKVITPLNNIKTVENEMMKKMTGDPVKDIVTVFTATGEISKTIGDKLGITSDNNNVFGERKSKLGKKSIGYKNNIKVKTVDKDGNEKEETLTMLQYLQRQLDPEVNDQLDNEERIFIATVMFGTSVSGINNYFNDDGSLTKLGEDFLEQVMPTLYERTATKNFRKTMKVISTLKSVHYEKSKTDAVNKSGANVTIKNSITVGGAPVTDGSDTKDISDDTPTGIKVNGKNKTIGELKEKPVVIIKDGIKYSVYVDENNKLRIIQMEDQQQQTQTQQQTNEPNKHNRYNMVQGIKYSDDAELQDTYERYYNQYFFNLSEDVLVSSLAGDPFVWDDSDEKNNEKRIAELKSKIEGKFKKPGLGSGEAKWLASWMQELNARLAHNQQQTETQEQQIDQQDENYKKREEKIDKDISKKNISNLAQHHAFCVRKGYTDLVNKIEEFGKKEGIEFINIFDGKIIGEDLNMPMFYDSMGADYITEGIDKDDKYYIMYTVKVLKSAVKKDGKTIERGWYSLTQSDDINVYEAELDKSEQRLNELRNKRSNEKESSFKGLILKIEGLKNSISLLGGDNIGTLEEGAFDTVEETNTDPITQDTTIPVSVFAEDYKELEGKLTPVETMLEKWDNIKSYIPYIARSKDLAGVQLFDYSKIASFHPNNVGDINISSVKINELNKGIGVDKLPIVSVKENGEWHDYSMIWLGDADITDLNGGTELGFNRHTEFKSMILVDFKSGEQIKKFVQNTIRPAKFKKNKLEKYKYCYYKNNIAYQITTKEGEPINQNRVISFTKSETFDKNGNPTVERYLSTLLQLERLAPNDQSLAFKNKRVFMSSAPVGKRSEGRLFRGGKDNDFKIEYDSRPIFTTSDVVFNNNNTAIKINGLTIDISKKNYDVVLDDSGELSTIRGEKTDINTLQKWFNFLWDKGKTMTPKGFIEDEQKIAEEGESDKILDKVVQDMPEHKSAKEVEKEFKDAVNTQNNNVETVKEYADSKVTPATESVEETIVTEQNKNAPILVSEGEVEPGFYVINKDVLNKAKTYWKEGKIPAVRRSVDGNPNHNFGNPFSPLPTSNAEIKVETIDEAVKRFESWLKGESDQDVNPEQRQWILDQINNGSLKGKDIVYYTDKVTGGDYFGNGSNVNIYNEDRSPSHAHILKALIDGININSSAGTTQSELDYIKAEAIKNGTFMKAPNGKRSNLSETNWLQVRTKDFKEWFGDWENDPNNASKVVDENGEPLLVYHGGARGIERFRLPTSGEDSTTGYGTYQYKKTGEIVPIDSNRTIFFSNSYFIARYYSDLRAGAELGITGDNDISQRDVRLNGFNMARKFINDYNNENGINELIKGELPNYLINHLTNNDKSRGHWNAGDGYVARDILYVGNDLSEVNALGRPDNEIYFEYYSNSGLSIKGTGKYEKYSGNLKGYDKDKLKEAFDIMLKLNEETMKSDMSKLRSVYKDKGQVYTAFLNIRNPFIHDYEGSGIGIGAEYKGKKGIKTGYVNARQVNKAIKDGNDGVIYENIKDPGLANNYGVFDPDNIRFASQQISDETILSQQEQAILDKTTPQNIPSTNQIVAMSSASNETVAEQNLGDPNLVKALVEDCKDLGIVLDSLEPEVLGQVINAYKNGNGINDVLKYFASLMPGSYVDSNILELLIKKGIVTDQRYNGLTLSEIIAFNYAKKKIAKGDIEYILKYGISEIGYNGHILGINDDDRSDLFNVLSDYYIRNYFNLDPTKVSTNFKTRFKTILKESLLESNIVVHEEDKINPLLKKEDDPATILELERLLHEDPSLVQGFAYQAYKNGLISARLYNYLMDSNSDLLVIGEEGKDYNLGPIAFSILESINLIPEIGNIIGDGANKNKLQLLFDVYNYFGLTKKCTYTGLVEYLNKKYESLPQDHIMKQLINVLDKDSKRVGVLYHSNRIIDSLQKNYSQDEKRTGEVLYKSFIKDVSDDQSIEDALKILEAEDSDWFIQIAAGIPTNIKKNLLKDFKEENKQDRSMNIAYRMVSFLLTDNIKVASDLKQENNKNLPTISGDTEKILKSFSPASLINAEVTKSLYKKFGLYGLDLNKGTVILTNNRQPSLGKYMDNFENVELLPIMPVSSLDEVSLDVNVIVPNEVSIPDNYKGNNDYNIIRMPYAGYVNGQLVVKKIGSETKDREYRAYNNLGLYGIGINLIDGFKLSDDNKKVILQNKNLKSMYWEIFKNNILPNIDEKNKNITQDEFEDYIVDSSIETLDDKILFKCFAANDIQNIIDNSISVINHVTNGQLALKSNNESCKNSIKTNRAIEQFAKYIKDKPISNNQKESLINMFDGFLVAQMQLGDIDLVKWLDNFRKEHKGAIQLLYSFPEIKSSANDASSLYQLFVNATNTNERPERALDIRTMNFTNASEKDISDIEKKIDTVRKNLEGLYLSDTQDENRIAILEKYLSELIDERNNMLGLTDEEKYNNDRFIEIYNPEAGAIVERDYDQFQESSLESEAASSEDKAYTDKTLKVLNVIYKSYIEPNRYTQSPREIASRKTNIVSTGLLGIITGENTFSNEYGNFNVGEETSNKYVFTSQNLTTLIQTLASLKQTNQKRYGQMIDSMFNTLKDVLFTAQKDDANSNLIKIKNQVYNNPFDLYKLYGAISRDPLYSISFKTGGKIEKNVEYKEVQTKALLQSASNEYLTTSPYINNTENGITSMNENVEEYHKLYDKYFENFIPKGSKASDEQVKAFAKIADAFNNRKNPGTYVDKDKVFALPGKAGTGKSTLELAFFKYVNEQGGAEYEIDNIINEKQTSLIYNFKIQEGSIGGKDGKYKKGKFATSNNDDKFYARIYNKDEYGNVVSEIYIEFNGGDNLINYNQLKDMSIDNILDGYSNIWDNNKRVAASALVQTNKYAEEGENFIRNAYADNTWKIKKFTVLDKKPEGVDVIDIVGRGPVIAPAEKTDQKFEHVHINKALSDIYFAVRTHKTVSSLIDIATKNGKEKFSGIHYGTEASYLEQDSSAEMSLLGYGHAPKVKDKVKEMTGNIIFIDESQNSYGSDLQAIVEQLGGQNVIVLLGDWHQETKSDYFESLGKGEDYMIESHRATNDINDMNEINSFTQKSSTQSNVIGYYIVDSDDYVRYENINPDWYKGKPKEYVMVTVRNNTRRKLNDDYLEALGAKIDRTEKGDLKSSDLKKIIDNGTTLQVMVIDVLSDQKGNKEGRRSEIPNEGLNMKGFQSKDGGKYYVKEDGKKIQIFFPSTKETDASDKKGYIRKVEDSYEKEWKKNGKEIELFVPAFAITTEKESGMTVDNIIIHDEVVNVDYDYFSKQNVKRFYDAFTRGAKKIFIPKYAPRLVGLTREDVHALMNGKPLEKAYIEKTDNKNEMENFVLPVISLRKKGGLEILDDIQTLLNAIGYDNYKDFLPIDFINNVYTLSSYDLGTRTYADYNMELLRSQRTELPTRDEYNSDIERLKKSIADDWDRYRDNITKYVDSDQLEKIVKKIDRVIYGFNYLIPKVTIEGKEILLDGKNGTTNKVIRGDPRYRNRIFTIKDLENEINEVKRSGLIQFVPYEPEFKDVGGQRMLVLKRFSPKTVQKVKPGWIDLNDQRKSSVIKLDAEKMKIEKIFNYQFDNDKISNKGFNLYDYESGVYPGTNYLINNVQDNEGTIFEPLDQSNLLENERQELKDKFWEELQKYMDYATVKFSLSDYDFYQNVDVPFKPTVRRFNVHGLDSAFGIRTIDPSIVSSSDTFRADDLNGDDAKINDIVNKIYEKYKGTKNKYYNDFDPNNLPGRITKSDLTLQLKDVKDLVYTTVDYGDLEGKEKDEYIFDEAHTKTSIYKAYEAINNIIENRDESDLDGLKSMIYNFIERAQAIDNGETTPGLDMSENEDKNIWINENQLWDDFDDAQNCEG